MNDASRKAVTAKGIVGKSLLAAVAVAGLTFNAASAAIITDPVPTDTSASIDRTLSDGTTAVTGANLKIANPGNLTIDTTLSPWNGNEFTYLISTISTDAAGGGLGNVTYEAGSGTFFQDFDAQIIVHRGSYGDSTSNALTGFTFEGSTDGVNFSTIAVTGTYVDMGAVTGDNAYADFKRYNAAPTDPSSLGELTALRIGMNAPYGQTWHQHFGAVSLDVVVIPEPSTIVLSSLALVGLGLRRRKRA